MALRIIDGVPGCGKTYFAVDHCLKSFYEYDPDVDRWKPRDLETVLITNIDSFSMGVSLEQEMEVVGGDVVEYFNYEFLAKRFENKRVVWIIDEAQALFHTKFFSQSVFLFFQKHRHLGFDFYLVTQEADLIVKSIRSLAEYYIRAVRRTLSLMGEFRYKFVEPLSGKAWRTKTLRRDPRVFAVYKSMVGFETEKMGSIPRKFLLLSAGLLIAAVLVLYGFVHYRLHRVAAPKPVAAVVSKSGDTSGKGVVGKVALGAFKAENLSEVEYETAESLVVGVWELDGRKLFLVRDLAGSQRRMSVDELTRFCKCHVDGLLAGSVFPVSTGRPVSGGAGGRGLSSPASTVRSQRP